MPLYHQKKKKKKRKVERKEILNQEK